MTPPSSIGSAPGSDKYCADHDPLLTLYPGTVPPVPLGVVKISTVELCCPCVNKLSATVESLLFHVLFFRLPLHVSFSSRPTRKKRWFGFLCPVAPKWNGTERHPVSLGELPRVLRAGQFSAITNYNASHRRAPFCCCVSFLVSLAETFRTRFTVSGGLKHKKNTHTNARSK